MKHHQNKYRKDDGHETAADAARRIDTVPVEHELPPVEDDQTTEPGTAGEPHHGLAGHAGSGKDARLESVGESESDRAAGSSS